MDDGVDDRVSFVNIESIDCRRLLVPLLVLRVLYSDMDSVYMHKTIVSDLCTDGSVCELIN